MIHHSCSSGSPCSDAHNLKKETIEKQYQNVSCKYNTSNFTLEFIEFVYHLILQVKARTSNYNTYNAGSHVMEYGNKSMKSEKLYLYQGFNPANANVTDNAIRTTSVGVINQRDADLLFLWRSVSIIILSIDYYYYFFSLCSEKVN